MLIRVSALPLQLNTCVKCFISFSYYDKSPLTEAEVKEDDDIMFSDIERLRIREV